MHSSMTDWLPKYVLRRRDTVLDVLYIMLRFLDNNKITPYHFNTSIMIGLTIAFDIFQIPYRYQYSRCPLLPMISNGILITDVETISKSYTNGDSPFKLDTMIFTLDVLQNVAEMCCPFSET